MNKCATHIFLQCRLAPGGKYQKRRRESESTRIGLLVFILTITILSLFTYSVCDNKVKIRFASRYTRQVMDQKWAKGLRVCEGITAKGVSGVGVLEAS